MVGGAFLALALASGARAAESGGTPPASSPVLVDRSILGASSCSTSGCHGGADEKSYQYVMWAQRDVHSRSYATLTTARAARMAESLQIADPLTSPRCTTCHAPFQAVQTAEPEQLAANAHVSEGVSCASCHGPEGGWLLSHTRADYNHIDRVAAGLRDLNNLYVRANTCVACHQNVDPELVAVGRHPQLMFELDGQTAAEPRHWQEDAGENGAQAWQVGQAVALRETSWALLHGAADPARETDRWLGLLWVLQRAALPSSAGGPASIQAVAAASGEQNFAQALEAGDQLARTVAAGFDPASVPVILKNLAATSSEFTDHAVSRATQARRAERLVLALDRLLDALPADHRPAAACAHLTALFAKVQSLPDFAPEPFAAELTAFAQTLP